MKALFALVYSNWRAVHRDHVAVEVEDKGITKGGYQGEGSVT